MKKNIVFDLAVIILVTGFIVFFKLGGLPLLDPDEPVYAQTAREMLAAHDFISPRIYGNFWYDKPPLYYWLVMGAFKFFGQTEFAARFPSALLAVCCALLVYFCGKSLFTRRIGLLSALVLSTSLEYFYLGRAAVTDMTLTFFLTASLLFYLRKKYYFAYAAVGMAVLTKGPIGIVLPIAIIFIQLILTHNLKALKELKIFSGGLLALIVFLPWYLMMYYAHGMDFIHTFLGFHNITRFLQPEHPAGILWYYYLPVLLIGFFPWTMFLVQSISAALQNREKLHGNILLFLVIWATVILSFFTASQTKLISYILPLYPPLALLVGWYIDRCITTGLPRIFKTPALLLTLLMIAIETGLVLTARNLAPALFPGVVITGLIFAASLGGTCFTLWRRNLRGFMGTLIMGMMAFVIVAMTQLLPAAAPLFSVKNFATEFNQYYDGQTPVYIIKSFRPGFMYYTGNAGVLMTTDKEFTDLVMSNDGRAYFVVKAETYWELTPSEQNKLQIVTSQKTLALLLKDGND
jgi:4-amino-4-deoxy-L-arabinose transferase-like glycosyltransferase